MKNRKILLNDNRLTCNFIYFRYFFPEIGVAISVFLPIIQQQKGQCKVLITMQKISLQLCCVWLMPCRRRGKFSRFRLANNAAIVLFC